MAVTKIWAIHDSVSRVVEYCSNPEKTKMTDLEQVLVYAANKAKTLDEGEQSYAVSCVNCTPDTAIKEMTASGNSLLPEKNASAVFCLYSNSRDQKNR